MCNLSEINKTIRLPNTTIMNIFAQLLFFLFSRMFARILQQYIFLTAASFMNIFHVWKRCVSVRTTWVSMQRMQMQSTNYIIMCIFLFIYYYFFFWWKKNSVFLGKTYYRRKSSIDQWIWNYIGLLLTDERNLSCFE